MESRQARAQLEGLRARKYDSWITPEVYLNPTKARPDRLRESNLASSRLLEALDVAIDQPPAKLQPSAEQEGMTEEIIKQEKDKIRKRTENIKNIGRKIKKIVPSFQNSLDALLKEKQEDWKTRQNFSIKG